MVTSTYDTVGGDLPLSLGGGVSRATGTNDNAFDVFVGGLSLNLHITKETPYQRQTAEWRKEQVDQSAEAGEQTLSSWWLRSQMSFHGGAGVKYLDTTVDPQSLNRIRFDDSRGVDVWTPGEVKRLPDTELAVAGSGVTLMVSAYVGGTGYLVYANGTTLKALKSDGSTITYTVTGKTGSALSLVTDGSHYYVATTDSKIFKGPIDGSSAGTSIWDTGSASDVTLGWVKQRLIAGIGNKVYELAGTGPTLPTALYTHPSPGWKWTAWSDAPDSVLGAGKNGLNSSIFGFTLSDATGTPVLAPGSPIAVLPTGETVESLYLYVGSRLAIGTSAGLRVGDFDNNYGSFQFGPLSIQTDAPVTALTGRGPFVYAGSKAQGEGLLYRLDLGQPVEDGPLYAYATDLRAPVAGQTGVVDALTVTAEGRIVFSLRGYGVVREATTYSGRDAWLRTSRLRFNTVEGKQFKYGKVRTEGTGSVTIAAQTNLTPAMDVFTTATDQDSQRFALLAGAAEWVQLTFTVSGTGKLTSYQVLALPAQPRQRLFAIPVQLFDSEKNRHNNMVGYQGRAKMVLDTLEIIESRGDEVTVQCPVLGIDAVRCTVERIEFTQSSPPTPQKSYGLGGYANLVFRTST